MEETEPISRDEAFKLAKMIDGDEIYVDCQELVYRIYESFESMHCGNCRHHNNTYEYYGECSRNGEPVPTEYTWFCAGYEPKEKR